MITIVTRNYILALGLIILIIYVYIEISIFKVKRLTIKQEKLFLKEKIKIIQISDYHNNKQINKKRLIKTIDKLSPDIIVLTGDMIDKKTESFDNVINLLKDLKKVNKDIYSVSGNHERNNEKKDKYEEELKKIGIINLDYKNKLLKVGKDKINLCGIPFKSSNKEKEVIYNNFSDKFLTILLSHSPNKALKIKNFKSDLILSGHTHGGQVRFPFIGEIITPEEGFSTTYSKGLYKLDYGKLYIDSGLGNSVRPIRLFNRVQISFIEIE